MRSFVNSASLLSLTLPVHNADLAPDDSLFAIQFNFEWRKLVTSALVFFYQHAETELALDNEDLLNSILLDLYNAESIGSGMISKSLGIDLATNKTTTSTSFVAVAGSGFNHTFTKPKALIRCSDIIASGSTGVDVTIKLDLAGLGPDNVQEARVNGAIARTLSCAHVYQGIPPGSRVIQLVWKVSAPTGTMNAGAYLHYEIIEYD